MSRQSLSEAIKKMEAHLTERLVSFSSKKIRETSEEIKEELNTEYNYFFQMIVDQVIGSLSTPGLLAAYTTWKPLSDDWAKYKGTREHYIGLSNSQTVGRALGRRSKNGRGIGMSRLRKNGRMPVGRNRIGSFQTYIQSLNSSGTTERFFGPISITYDFQAPNLNISVHPEQADGVVKRTRIKSFKRGGKFVDFPKTLKLSATITAFGKLKGVKFDEWHVVDYIIKRADPANEKQWVKINSTYGFGRTKRPIRAVVTPILRYYMDKRFGEIVQDAIKSRGK